TASAFAASPDLRVGEFAHASAAQPTRIVKLFRPAIAVAALALLLQIGGTVVEWACLKLDIWRTTRAVTAFARAAELPDGGSPEAAARAIARWHADLRHRVGLTARSDALPLLARAAPALSSLAPNMVKSATYADGAWTIE